MGNEQTKSTLDSQQDQPRDDTPILGQVMETPKGEKDVIPADNGYKDPKSSTRKKVGRLFKRTGNKGNPSTGYYKLKD